jgi:hypothetical protein
MSIFSMIKDAIFGHKAQAATLAPDTESPAIPMDQAAPSAAAPAPQVDVEATCAAMPGADGLNWRSSIVDLMKLLGIDSSLSNRESLAKELGYTGDFNGSAEMNIWLHKATMAELAKNGGLVPAAMLG